MTKRQVTVIGNRLRIITAPNEIRDNIEWVKNLVRLTNEKVDEYNKEVEHARKTEEDQRLKEQETIQKMKDSLKKH